MRYLLATWYGGVWDEWRFVELTVDICRARMYQFDHSTRVLLRSYVLWCCSICVDYVQNCDSSWVKLTLTLCYFCIRSQCAQLSELPPSPHNWESSWFDCLKVVTQSSVLHQPQWPHFMHRKFWRSQCSCPANRRAFKRLHLTVAISSTAFSVECVHARYLPLQFIRIDP